MLREQPSYQGLFIFMISDDDHDTKEEHDVMAEEMMTNDHTISMMIVSTLISNKLSSVCFLRELKLN